MAFLTLHIRSNALDLNTTVNVIIPQDIKKDEKLKVLYLLHGYIGDHTDWVRYTSIERYSWNYRYAIIMPAVNNSYYMDTVSGLNYFTYVSKELPELMASLFPISTKREDTYVAGLSMGGYGALKIALTYPDRYAKAASLSGALDIDEIKRLANEQPRNEWFNAVFGLKPSQNTPTDLKYLIDLHLKHDVVLPDLYVACGTEDFLYQDNLKFKEFLEKRHVKHHYEESPGVHDWAFWDQYIQKVLAWL
ncbi:MAG: alpha/beta hydrolase family protein [Acholeplasmataceae bacterium]|jgi:S-formylglutathione hydrolase FrmB|nr:alpha/beta hydrolase family protein [Acholeplasmataceae bacterium]